MMNYEQDIAIDEEALDVEWLGQAQLMLKYGRHAAKKREVLDQAKEALEVVKARLYKKIRLKPASYGIIERVTEAVVQNIILLQSKYKTAAATCTHAKYEYEMAMVAVRALDQRKTALENLVRLHGMAYFAGPSVPRNLTKEWEAKEHQKKANTTVQLKRKRK